MRKTQLAGQLARQSGVTKAEAADRLDRVVHQIVTNLRKGRAAALPGLGHFLPSKAPGEKWAFEFKTNSDSKNNEGQRSGDARR
jgi:nucleoid DNA-binding protein